MSFGKTVNLGNSIIGVSILAMPYCFVQSGLILSIVLIVFSGFLTRLSCHLLLKSAYLSKRRSFELMVQDVLGSMGRILVEIGLIGFLLGTCVAYFIMIGDLAPEIVTEILGVECNHRTRILTIVALSVFVALPLSLLKKVDSLTSLSILSLILYSSLILKLIFETTDRLEQRRFIVDEAISNVSFWNISGLLTTFPIFSMAMSCQTSLFEIFDSKYAVNDLENIRRDDNIIKKAIYMCSIVYITVGLLGYMAFYEQTFYGNILLAFPQSFTTTLTKIGFVISLLLSFPLCLFPCRTSVYSLTIGKMSTRPTGFKSVPTSEYPEQVQLEDDSNDCDNNQVRNDTNNNHSINQAGNTIKHHHDIILPMVGKSAKIIPSNILRLQTMTTSSNTTYSYTKLLSDEDELSLDYDITKESGHATRVNGISSTYNDSAHQLTKLHMSDLEFKLLTIFLIATTVTLSLLFPNIEFILGIIGSTAGTTVCFVLPAFTFLKIGEHSRAESYLANLLLTIGLGILVFCTYSTIHKANLHAPLETTN